MSTILPSADQHIENALAKIKTFFVEASVRIEALQGTEKIPATKLAEEIASKHDMTGAQLYPILRILFENYPGVEISRGAHGGIRKVQPKPEPTVTPVVEPSVTVQE